MDFFHFWCWKCFFQHTLATFFQCCLFSPLGFAHFQHEKFLFGDYFLCGGERGELQRTARVLTFFALVWNWDPKELSLSSRTTFTKQQLLNATQSLDARVSLTAPTAIAATSLRLTHQWRGGKSEHSLSLLSRSSTYNKCLSGSWSQEDKHMTVVGTENLMFWNKTKRNWRQTKDNGSWSSLDDP